MYMNIKIEITSQYFLTQKASLIGFINCLVQNPDYVFVFSSHINISGICAQSVTRTNHPFDQKMWNFFHQVTVFKCTWFTFISITNQIAGQSRFFIDKAPLHSGRKSRTSPAPESGFLDLFSDFVRCHRLQCLFDRKVTT